MLSYNLHPIHESIYCDCAKHRTKKYHLVVNGLASRASAVAILAVTTVLVCIVILLWLRLMALGVTLAVAVIVNSWLLL